MGAEGGEIWEQPEHKVTVEKFALGKYEVTFDQWDACQREGGCGEAKDEGWGRGKNPVINVSWDAAQSYVKWLSKKTGKAYRLPSEAEWEYAARAGTKTSRYWGNRPENACQYANVFDESVKRDPRFVEGMSIHNCNDGYIFTAPVGSFKPNQFGLYDMLGNVKEWVQDCYYGDYLDAPTDGREWKWKKKNGEFDTCQNSERVVRGGSFFSSSPVHVRSAAREHRMPSEPGKGLGFRVARSLP